MPGATPAPPPMAEPPGPERPDTGRPDAGRPDAGPRGYLPERAAKRARKIVLREQMGLGWPVAAVLAGLLLAGLGLLFLMTRAGPPGAPYRDLGALEDVDPRGAALVGEGAATALVVRAGGGVRVYEPPSAGVAYCAASDALEARSTGQVWDLRGRLIGGDGASLRPLPAQVHAGRLWIDVTHPGPPPAPDPAEDRAVTTPVC